jgi:DNA-binding NarL/FixJ family response regulator
VLSSSRVSVLVVDDFEPFRVLLGELLRQRPEFQIVAEASDGPEAVQKAGQLQPDVILLDIGLPSMNGIEATRQIGEVAPESKIIFVTQELGTAVVQEALSSGAWGYVAKTRVRSDLLKAIEAVLEGKRFIGTGLKLPAAE